MIYAFFNEKSAFFGLVTRVHRHVSENAGYKEYNEKSSIYGSSDTSWSSCSLRMWLNGTFLNNAFSNEEQNMILSLMVNSDKNPKYGTSSGKDTLDKVFLLSVTELNNYFESSKERICYPTKFAKTLNNSCFSEGEWWLRTPGRTLSEAAHIYINGEMFSKYVGESIGVRPSLWVNTDSLR